MPSLQLMSLNSRRYNLLISSNLKAKWYTCHERTKSIVCRQWQYNIRTQNEIWWTFHFSLAFNANMVPVLTQLTVQLIIIWCNQLQSDFVPVNGIRQTTLPGVPDRKVTENTTIVRRECPGGESLVIINIEGKQ